MSCGCLRVDEADYWDFWFSDYCGLVSVLSVSSGLTFGGEGFVEVALMHELVGLRWLSAATQIAGVD